MTSLDIYLTLAERFVCPDCISQLITKDDRIACTKCSFSTANSHPLDMRAKHPIRSFSNELGAFDPEQVLSRISQSRPRRLYDGPTGMRDSRELLSAILESGSAQGSVLDLGCGPGDQRAALSSLGYKYIGVDYTSQKADMLADAHALPFSDGAFECVFSYAVLEHLYNPFLALTEIRRILRTGGIFVGTVAQGEPFHNSYFHCTLWGLLSLANFAGLEVLKIWPCGDTLRSISTMGRYPKVIRLLLRIVETLHRWMPFLAPRRLFWKPEQKVLDELFRAGALGYVMRKS